MKTILSALLTFVIFTCTAQTKTEITVTVRETADIDSLIKKRVMDSTINRRVHDSLNANAFYFDFRDFTGTGAIGNKQRVKDSIVYRYLITRSGFAAGKVLGTDGTNLIWVDGGSSTPGDSALIFDQANGVTESPTGVWTGTLGSGGDLLSYGLGTKHLNEDGYIQFRYVDASSYDAIIGFNDTNADEGYTSFEAAFWVGSVGSHDIIVRDNGTNIATVPAVVGNYYRVSRSGSDFVLTTSADLLSWSTLHTYTYTSLATMYIGINPDFGKKVYSPRGYGLSY